MPVILRAASATDEPFIRGLIRETIAIELGAASWPAAIRDPLLDIQANIRYPATVSAGPQFVIEVDGAAAGWILLAPMETELRLAEIMVRPEMRGKGIGSAAIREIIRSGHGPVILNVNATNSAAIRLYERLGFEICSWGEVQHVMKCSRPGAALLIFLLLLLPPFVRAQDSSPRQPSAEVWLGNSYRLYRLGRYEDSLDAARKALRQRPGYALAWNNIAAADLQLGKWQQAAEAAGQAVRLQPDDNDLARNNLAEALLYLSQSPEGAVARSRFYFDKGRYDETIREAYAALNLRPDYAEAWNNLAAAYNCLARWSEAIQAAQRAVAIKPDFELARNNLALAVNELKKSASRPAP